MEKIGELFGVPVIAHDGDVPSVILMKQSDALSLMATLIAGQKMYPATVVQHPQPAKCRGCMYWQGLPGNLCIRGASEESCIKFDTQQADAADVVRHDTV